MNCSFSGTDWSGTSEVSQYLSVMPPQPPVVVWSNETPFVFSPSDFALA